MKPMTKIERAQAMLIESAIQHGEDMVAALKRCRADAYAPSSYAKLSTAAEACAKAEHKILKLMIGWQKSDDPVTTNEGTVTVDPELMKPGAAEPRGNVIDVIQVL